MPLFQFPGEPEWDDEAGAVAFEVQLGDYQGRVFVSRRTLQAILGHALTAEAATQRVCLERDVFERAAELRLTERRLDPDANVHLTPADLKRAFPS